MAVCAAALRPRKPRRYAAQAVFFPLAAAYAAIAVPLSVHGMAGGTPRLAGLSTPSGHAHEMLFGFAFAVVAGFTIAALGTLTITTMARTRRVSLKRSTARLPGIGFALLLIAIAAALRISSPQAWPIASALWSAAYATLLVHLLWLQFARQ